MIRIQSDTLDVADACNSRFDTSMPTNGECVLLSMRIGYCGAYVCVLSAREGRHKSKDMMNGLVAQTVK